MEAIRNKRAIRFCLCLVLAGLLTGCGTAPQHAGPDPGPEKAAAAKTSPAPVSAATPSPEPTPDPEEAKREERLEREQDGFVWEKGYLCAVDEEGGLKTDCYIGVLYFGKDGHYTSGSRELDRLVAEVIRDNTDDSMSRMEKLRAVYDYTRDNIDYLGYGNHEYSYQPAHGKDGWMTEIAAKALKEKLGNCYYFAAEFTALARGLGYQAYCTGGVFSAMEDPHGWCQIVDENGEIWLCDPEMEYRLLDWKERGGDVEKVSDCFYRNQTELEGETGMGYASFKDPFEPERREAENREHPLESGSPADK